MVCAPPIADNEQWAILNQFYKTPFFFSSKVIEQNTPLYIELKKIYRQNEQEFIDLLNRVRVNQVTRNDFQTLNSKYNPTFSGDGSDYIILATHNKIVNETNLTKLNQLETELFTFEANVTGAFPDKHKPTDHYLKLKVGAQIMFIKNDTGKYKRYFNGKIGKIKELEENITVVFDDESEVEVERTVWNNIQYTYNKEKKKVEEKIIGTFEQFPIRLAWAITVHKSQGLTFEKVIADLGRAFTSGQVYVALSRCTSFNGLILKTQLNQYAIKTDPRVLEFAENETPSTLVVEQLNTGKADFYYKKARENLAIGNILSVWNNLIKAIKFRNDIETERFKQYFLIHAEKLLGFKKQSLKLSNRLELTDEKLSELKDQIEITELEVTSKNEKLVKQDEAVKLLLNRVELLENENKEQKNISAKLQENKRILKDNLNNLDNKTNRLSNEILKLNNKIKKIEKKNEEQKNEIERLKNIKWHQKIFGRK